ncbi:BamA/TamA family outer membrane protein [Arcticibacter svalbardensis]|nr:BamA/TamA family outer membrane protein [Arcticibacter svalbardensis]
MGRLKSGLRFSILFSLTVLSTFAFSQPASGPDSIYRPIAAEYAKVSSSHEFWLGSNYRKLWATPVKIKVLSLAKEHNGLTIIKLGGGMQTKSLRLKDATGKEWVLRTIQKFPERNMPVNLRKTVAQSILHDQISAINPFGALAVPPLTAALGIPHTNPQIVYVEDDPLLGPYREDFKNSVYIFEERAPVDEDKTDNTAKVQRKVQEDNDTEVDQKLVLRARLLDMILGDWDRHEDQWRWEKIKDKKDTKYVPVPRDRDQVFYKTSGVLPWIISHQWLKSRWQGYSETLRDVKGWNFNARYFDRYFLNGLSRKDWTEQVQFVQKTLSDSLIRQAIHRWPDPVFALAGEEVIRNLKARRDELPQTASTYYKFISETVEVPASDKNESFNLKYRDNGDVELRVYNIKKDGKEGRSIYHRTFERDVTKEIRLYGFKGNNRFNVIGSGKSPIVVRMVGGSDADNFSISPQTENKSKLFVYDGIQGPDSLPSRSLARLKLSADTAVHSYDKTSFKYDRKGPLFAASYDLDQGLLLRAGILVEKQGFRKDPFAYKHELWANYSTGRSSFKFNYSGEYTKLIGENDLKIDVNSLGPNNLSNFFGRGNESVFVNSEEQEIGYYRNRYDYVSAEVKLNRNISPVLKIDAGIASEYYTSSASNNEERFFRSYAIDHPSEGIYGNRFYAGVVSDIHVNTRKNAVLAYDGIVWNTRIALMKEIGNGHAEYAKLQSDFTFYFNMADSNLVIANRIGGGTTLGSPQFYQAMQLGGQQNLRGFHTNRFNGRSMLFHNIELRLKLFDFTSYLFPGTFGLTAFNDIGRVWQPGESSDKWHEGYGGGIYLVPAELIIIQGAVGFSKEGTMPYISLGFRF